MRPAGLSVVIIAFAVPFLWLPGIAQGRDAVALGSQYLGIAALIGMAISMLIATRWPGIEAVFGPMDQGYRLHKWLGIGALVALLLHDTIDADMRGLGQATALVDAAETAGEISLYGLIILVAITVATFIPYNLWKWTHRLIGIFFVLGAAHFAFILKPFANTDPLGLYVNGICALGILAYLWTSAPRRVRPAAAYKVTGLRPEGDALAVTMTPDGKKLRHLPGQFAFFAFTGAGLNEPHPFTLSAAPRADGQLQVTIAPLGDFTVRVAKALAEGQSVRVDGPYGRFGRGAPRPQVWVAAGIGITPFLALAEALAETDPPVTLIYSVRDAAKAAHLDAVRALAAAKPNLDLHLWESASSGRLTSENVAALAGDNLSKARVMFCGPVALRKALAEGLTAHGVNARDFHYEEFEIRTGLGLKRFANWLWERRTGIQTAK